MPDDLFEIHLTVDASRTEIDELARMAEDNNAKLVIIELASGVHPFQPMLTWNETGLKAAARASAESMAHSLSERGYSTVRIKVEAHPDNTGVPQTDKQALQSPALYFEHHWKLSFPDTSISADLHAVADRHDARWSRNPRKVTSRECQRLLTARHYWCGKASSFAKRDSLTFDLERVCTRFGITILKVESEYCVYDSAVELDRLWIDPPNGAATDA